MDLKEEKRTKNGLGAKSLLKTGRRQIIRIRALFEKDRFQSHTLPRCLRAVGLFFAAYLLSGAPMLFGCYPMGLSLLCAAGNDLFFIWLGCFFAALNRGSDLALFLTVYSLLFAVKLHFFYRFKEKKRDLPFWEEPTAFRVTLSVLGALTLGLYGCFTESFSLHAFFALLFYLLSAGTLTFLLSGAFKKAPYQTLLSKIGTATLAVLVVFSSDSFSLFGFSAALPLATLFILLTAQKEHPLFCALAGLFFGLACDRALALPIATVGGAAGLLKKVSPRTAPWIALLSGFALAFYTKGSSAVLYTLPDMVCGLLLFLPINGYLKKKKEHNGVRPPLQEEATAPDPFSPALFNLSDKLSSLSQVFRQPDRERAVLLCQRAVGGVCRDCGADCFSTKKRLHALSDTLFETGRLLSEKPAEGVSSGCTRYDQLCLRINEEYAAYLEELHAKDPARCYAECYEGMARLIEDRAKLTKKAEEENEEYARRFKMALDHLKIGYGQVSVKGTRALQFRAKDAAIADLSKGAPDLRAHFEKECGLALTLPRLCFSEKEGTLCFERRPAISLHHGSARKKKHGEDYCGDTLLTFEQDGFGYFLLCDGMGSGMNAALSSGIACCFIEQLTCAGGSLETVFKTVNDFLLGQKNECTTTVDLLKVDLYDGSCEFVKSGACPSVVLRGGNLFKISSASMPLGSAKESNCERIALHLKAGDRVIMASDGVAADIEGSAWLKELLAGKLRTDPQGLAEDILSLCQDGSLHPDDRSITVIDLVAPENDVP